MFACRSNTRLGAQLRDRPNAGNLTAAAALGRKLTGARTTGSVPQTRKPAGSLREVLASATLGLQLREETPEASPLDPALLSCTPWRGLSSGGLRGGLQQSSTPTRSKQPTEPRPGQTKALPGPGSRASPARSPVPHAQLRFPPRSRAARTCALSAPSSLPSGPSAFWEM